MRVFVNVAGGYYVADIAAASEDSEIISPGSDLIECLQYLGKPIKHDSVDELIEQWRIWKHNHSSDYVAWLQQRAGEQE
jgi:hypothetical protein